MANNVSWLDALRQTKIFKTTETTGVHVSHINVDNLAKVEDAVHASGDAGVMLLGVRKDTPVNLSGADGDYEPVQISGGRIWVNASVGSPGTGATDLGKAEDAVHASGDVGVAALAVRKDTPTALASADGDYASLTVDGLNRLWTAGPKFATLAATPTVSTSPAYTAGDLVGGKLTFANATLVAAGSGMVRSLVLTDLASQNADIDLLLFDADPSGTTFTDNAALDIADADLVKLIAIIPITTDSAFLDNAAAFLNNVNAAFKLTSGTSLYGALVARGTPTYVGTTDLTLRLVVEQH